MRVFLTGATGYIGGTVAQRLLAAGHEVVGLARSEESADRVAAMGATAHRGDLQDLASLREGSAAAEGVIHTGFSVEDWSKLDVAFAQERAAVEAMLSALQGTGQPFIYTSGAGIYEDTGDEVFDETVAATAEGDVALRAEIEQAVIQASAQDVRSVVIRPGLVYGKGGSGIVHMMAGLVRQAGGTHTVGDGGNVWSAVHVEDLADLYLLALENASATGIFHASSEDEASMRDIASAIARALNLTGEAVAWPVDDAKSALGPLAKGLASNKRISAARARDSLGWQPHRARLIEEIERGSYPAVFDESTGREA
ncbi:MAG: NAD-dependent epimerase/dehydratase family protein [Planctomycetota bacterium]